MLHQQWPLLPRDCSVARGRQFGTLRHFAGAAPTSAGEGSKRTSAEEIAQEALSFSLLLRNSLGYAEFVPILPRGVRNRIGCRNRPQPINQALFMAF